MPIVKQNIRCPLETDPKPFIKEHFR